jgi:predicted metal-dependent hydrolase
MISLNSLSSSSINYYYNIDKLTSKQIYQYGNQKIKYNLVRSKRRKTSEIIVDEKEIILRVPFDKPLSEIEKILSNKIRWIIEKQKQQEKKEKEIIQPTYQQDSTLPYLGNNYRLKIIRKNESKNNEYDEITFNDGIFIAILKNNKKNIEKNNEIQRTKLLYENWLKQKCNSVYERKLTQFSKELDVIPKNFVIKNLKNRWGSLSKKGTIVLNIHLIKAPEQIIDYIIIHELCHLKIQGHSHHFWKFLKQFEPDYEKKIKWLELNSKNILLS